MIDDVLKKIAGQIMALNEENLTALLPKYKAIMNEFAPTREWEESVIIYFLINGLRIKNSQFNDKIKDYMASLSEHDKAETTQRPQLRLIVPETENKEK